MSSLHDSLVCIGPARGSGLTVGRGRLVTQRDGVRRPGTGRGENARGGRAAVAVIVGLAVIAGVAGWQRDLSASPNKSGDAKTVPGDTAGASAAHSDTQAISERLAGSDPSNVQWQLDVVFSLWKLSGPGLAAPHLTRGYLQRGLKILAGLEGAGRLPGSEGHRAGLLRERLHTLGDGAE